MNYMTISTKQIYHLLYLSTSHVRPSRAACPAPTLVHTRMNFLYQSSYLWTDILTKAVDGWIRPSVSLLQFLLVLSFLLDDDDTIEGRAVS